MSWTLDRVRDRLPGNMLGLIGFTPIAIESGRCVATMEVHPHLQQPMGMLHTGAIVTLADAAATYAALTLTDADATFSADRFPLAIQVSTNIMRNTDHGTIIADARVTHGGRTTQVVTTEVRDEEQRLLAVVTTTHIVVPRSVPSRGRAAAT